MTQQVIIGSTAMNYWFPKFNRKPKDLDIVVPEYRKNTLGTEHHLNPYLLQINPEQYITPENMLALKVSHMFWDNNWDKHMWDIQFLLRNGVEFNSHHYKQFREYWNEVLPKLQRSDLEMTKESFFTNNVNEDTDQHDNLHELLNPVPMFTRLLKDGCDVELDESKWDVLSFEEKCDVIYEETIVMMVERYSKNWRHNYVKQLQDNIRVHFPEYIALFAIFNYPFLERLPKKYNIEPLLIKLNKKL